mmetsp:Transcript_12859/g.18728  ORF Transcript_12859/g.18728 Transcript_12859/m.18728 type:complete len:302 (+) Transcript_12859:22-927(+)
MEPPADVEVEQDNETGARPTRGGTSRWRQNTNATRHDTDLALLRQTAVATAKRKAAPIEADDENRSPDDYAETAILPPPAPDEDAPQAVPPPIAAEPKNEDQSGGAESSQHRAEAEDKARIEEVVSKPPPTIEELIQDLQRHGPCKVFDVVVERASVDQPLGMDVKHARNKLIIKTIYEDAMIMQQGEENPDNQLLVGDVILSINDVIGDTNLMVAACRKPSPAGDANLEFKVLRFTNIHQRPYAKVAQVQKPVVSDEVGTNGEDYDDDSIGPTRTPSTSTAGSTCRVIARAVCRPLRSKV